MKPSIPFKSFNQSLWILALTGALSLTACHKHHDHMGGAMDGHTPPPAMADAPSEIRTIGNLKIEVQGAWARATVAGQNMGGAFVNLTSDQDAVLLGGSSPAAEKVQLHTMKMDGDKMMMSEVPSIALPAHSKVELKPSGFHLMLMGLKSPLQAGENLPLKLEIKDKSGKSGFLELQIPIQPAAHEGMGKPKM